MLTRCVALWEAVYGQRPLDGRTIDALVQDMRTRTLRRPSETKLPRAVHEVLVRGLSLDPMRRWPSMSALLDALERCLQVRRGRVRAGVALLVLALIATVVTLVEQLRDRDLQLHASNLELAHELELSHQTALELERSLSVQRGLRAV